MLVEYSALIVWTLAAIAVVFLAPSSIYVVAFSTFGAIIAASLLIAWAAEASESSISRGLALAIVAIVQTIPEYFVEGTIAWKAGKDPGIWLHNVIANFTGANRLLTGFGWPLILLTLIVQRRRNGQQGASTIALRREQSIEVVFMLGASLYYVWVLIEEELTIFDAIVWVGIFVAYMWMLARLPRGKEGPEEPLLGPSLAIVEIKSTRKRTGAILGLFLFAGLTFVLITDSFVTSIQNLAQMFLVGLLGPGAVFFTIQWIAPVLSEFPEKVTAFNWARQITLAPLALLNFISSSVNELTALVALIPVVYFVSSEGSLRLVCWSQYSFSSLRRTRPCEAAGISLCSARSEIRLGKAFSAGPKLGHASLFSVFSTSASALSALMNIGTFSIPVAMKLDRSHSPGANSSVFSRICLSIVKVSLTTVLS